jgi:hypothetical protein
MAIVRNDLTPSTSGTTPEARDPDGTTDERWYHDDGLLAVAGPIMVLCYALVFLDATLTFHGTGTALFAVVISIGFAIMFFGLPAVFAKTRAAHDQRWIRDEQAKSQIVEVWTGKIRRWEAVVQIVSIPVAILLGFSLLCLRWATL